MIAHSATNSVILRQMNGHIATNKLIMPVLVAKTLLLRGY